MISYSRRDARIDPLGAHVHCSSRQLLRRYSRERQYSRMDPTLLKRLVLSASTGIVLGVAGCGSTTPEPSTPAAEEHGMDKNSCAGGGPGHSCGAPAPASPQGEQQKGTAGVGNVPQH